MVAQQPGWRSVVVSGSLHVTGIWSCCSTRLAIQHPILLPPSCFLPFFFFFLFTAAQVPVGLSSALGYLHLGQVARVKVPPHLMEQTIGDTGGWVCGCAGVVRAMHLTERRNRQCRHAASRPQKESPCREEAAHKHTVIVIFAGGHLQRGEKTQSSSLQAHLQRACPEPFGWE